MKAINLVKFFSMAFIFLATLSILKGAKAAEENLGDWAAIKLIFVYNADSGLFATVSDFTHKISSPETYSCNLCLITYGNLGMKREWKDFLDTLPQEKIFLHRNQFSKKYPRFKDTLLPAIFTVSGKALKELVSAEEINQQKDIAGLKELVLRKLKEVNAL